MRILRVLLVSLAFSCGGDDANTCELSPGCDFVVDSEEECPDPINDPTVCSRGAGGGECCYCEDGEQEITFIDC